MGEFRMPSLGADMETGTLLEWLVSVGDEVHRGDLVAVVDTDKATIEVEVFEDGVVESLLVEPGTVVAVGAPLAVIGSETTAAKPAAAPVPRPSGTAVREVAPPAKRPHVSSPLPRHRAKKAPARAAAPGRSRSSPLARRLAAANDVDLASLTGTGPGGAVVARDLARRPAVEVTPTPSSAPSPSHAVPATSAADKGVAMRRAIAELMARSKREIPHYYLTSTIDLSRAVSWLHETNAGRPVSTRLVPAVLLLKAAALAARQVPDLNGFWGDGHFEASPSVHLGVAVALRPSGLVAPAILDADTLDLDTLMSRLADLVARARSGRLRQSEMSAPTITVTNLGEQGVESVLGVIYPPQVALVGFGRVVERPWAVDGLLGVRPVVTVTLAGDHRASDGHRGGRLLSAIDTLLQKPEEL